MQDDKKISIKPRATFYFSLIASVILALDQLSKHLIRSNLTLGESVPEDGFIRFTHVQNTGASFGLFQDFTDVLIFTSVLGAVLVLVLFLRSTTWLQLNDGRIRLVLGLMMGGILGNLVDRIDRGYVTDFIDIGPWPAFNVADSAVVCGTILFCIIFILRFNSEQVDES
jgi:signal peptidase II